MAPGSTAQKRKKQLVAIRERNAAEAAARLETGTLVPIPSLEDTNSSGLGAAAVDGDDGPPRSIRTKRGPQKPGLGGALRRTPKTRGGARMSRNDAVVENLKRQLATVTEQRRIEEEQRRIEEEHRRIEEEQSRIENEKMQQRIARLEVALNDFIWAQGNPGVNVAATTPIITDKSSCASSCIPEENLD